MLYVWIVLVFVCVLGIGFVLGASFGLNRVQKNYVRGSIIISDDESPYLSMDRSINELRNNDYIVVRVKKI